MLGHGKRGFEYQAWCNSSFQNFPTSTEDVPFEQNWLPYDNIMLVLEVKCLWLSLSFLLSLCLSCHLVSLSLCMLRFWEQQCTNCVSGKKEEFCDENPALKDLPVDRLPISLQLFSLFECTPHPLNSSLLEKGFDLLITENQCILLPMGWSFRFMVGVAVQGTYRDLLHFHFIQILHTCF